MAIGKLNVRPRLSLGVGAGKMRFQNEGRYKPAKKKTNPIGTSMPAVSSKQQKFMGADLARAKAGKKTKTGMSVPKLREFASFGLKGKGKGK